MSLRVRNMKPAKHLDDESKMEEWRRAGSQIAAAIPRGRTNPVMVPWTNAPKGRQRLQTVRAVNGS